MLRRHHIPFALGHLCAIFDDHALSKEAYYGLVVMDHPNVTHELGPEARINEMENGMLHAADVLVNGKPVVDRGGIERTVCKLRVGIAVKVPGRIDERVHGIGLTPRRAAAPGARDIYKLRHVAERRAALHRNSNIVRQGHRDLSFRYRHYPARGSIEHGNRRAPVALPGNAQSLSRYVTVFLPKPCCSAKADI